MSDSILDLFLQSLHSTAFTANPITNDNVAYSLKHNGPSSGTLPPMCA